MMMATMMTITAMSPCSNLPPTSFPHCEYIECGYFVHAGHFLHYDDDADIEMNDDKYILVVQNRWILCPCRSLEIVTFNRPLLLDYENYDDDVDIEMNYDNYVLVVQNRPYSKRKKKIFKNISLIFMAVAKTNRLYDDVVVKLPIIIQVKKNCL